MIIESPHNGKIPKIHESVFIAPNATIIGDVEIGEGSNIWFGAVLRGDWGRIRIGKYTSIQENVTIHMELNKEVNIGDNCIIGHHAMVHGPCIVENGSLIGIGANLLQNSKLGEGCLLGSGAVLTNKEIPPRKLVVGIPAEIKKDLRTSGKPIGEINSIAYYKNGQKFKKLFEKLNKNK
jgi:carbonic anhydrase/acetyltransferase-like protein (isoleucine patch superfamily)